MSPLDAVWLILAGLVVLIILYLVAMMLGLLVGWIVARKARGEDDAKEI